jgi:hypothetical protein
VLEQIRDAGFAEREGERCRRRAAESVTAAILKKLLHLPTVRMNGRPRRPTA